LGLATSTFAEIVLDDGHRLLLSAAFFASRRRRTRPRPSQSAPVEATCLIIASRAARGPARGDRAEDLAVLAVGQPDDLLGDGTRLWRAADLAAEPRDLLDQPARAGCVGEDQVEERVALAPRVEVSRCLHLAGERLEVGDLLRRRRSAASQAAPPSRAPR